jgi:CHAT domain-containing protein
MLVMADPVFEFKDARLREKKPETKVSGVQARFYQDLMRAVAEGDYGSLSLSRLFLTGDLAKDLETLYKGNCTVLTGLDVSKENFLNRIAPGLGDYDRIVFATHGYFGTELAGINEPVLVFTLVPPGIDGYLRMTEVMGLKMNADIAALTACQTGLGRALSGEGTMGMGRAFQYAGARSVLMSLWSVAEKSSVHLVGFFFRHRKEGKSKLDALKLARDEIRKAGYDHPFFWAAFILVGEVD